MSAEDLQERLAPRPFDDDLLLVALLVFEASMILPTLEPGFRALSSGTHPTDAVVSQRVRIYIRQFAVKRFYPSI